MLKALVFDVDGTLAETEDAHRIAFNRAFSEFGTGWVWGKELYHELLLTTGGRERIRAYQQKTGDTQALDIPEIHARKTEIYKELIASGCVALRPGVACLIRVGHAAGLKLAIATTTSRPNVEALFENTIGTEWLEKFDAICCGEEVEKKKPDPAVYELALQRMGLPAEDCVAFEDSRAGLIAAKSAGISQIVITPSLYTNDHDFTEATVMLRNLGSYYSYVEIGSGNPPGDLPEPLPKLLHSCIHYDDAE